MDIDIATYRVRIGTFNPRALNLKTKVTKPKKKFGEELFILQLFEIYSLHNTALSDYYKCNVLYQQSL